MNDFFNSTELVNFDVFNENALNPSPNVELNRHYLSLVGLLQDVDAILSGEITDEDQIFNISLKIHHCIGDLRLQRELMEFPNDETTEEPTEEPTENPTENPTEDPTEEPTENPTEEPTENENQE